MNSDGKNVRDTRKWLSVESTTCFNFYNLLSKVKKNLQTRFPEIKGDPFIQLMYKSLKTFKLGEQIFEYSFLRNNLGGVKWYIKCPKCGRDSYKLYLPTKSNDREQSYLSMKCHKLKHASSILGNSKRYLKVVKPLKELEKIRAKLLKRNISNDKAKELLDEYERIEKELASSSEYRLWRFQKEHGVQL